MPKITGPTVPRWQLGNELARLRDAAGLSHSEVAAVLGCSESTARKIELGHTSVSRGDLLLLLDTYQVADAGHRALLEDLRTQGSKRGWWSKHGTLPWTYATFLGLQSGAVALKSFESSVVPGLLQINDYTRAVVKGATPNINREEIERQVAIRHTHQENVLGEDPPTVWAVLDEIVIQRPIGGRDVMRAQLKRLLEVADEDWCTLQVVPISHGAHPGTLGAFTILEFDEQVHSPVVYVEGIAGNIYLEKDDDLQRCTLAFQHIVAAAASPPESAALIAAAMEEMS